MYSEEKKKLDKREKRERRQNTTDLLSAQSTTVRTTTPSIPKNGRSTRTHQLKSRRFFFDVTVPFKNTLHRHFETDGEAKKFRFDASIVDNLIGNFFFDMDDRSNESEDSEDKELVENIEKRKRPTLKPAEVKRKALDVFVLETEYRSEDAV